LLRVEGSGGGVSTYEGDVDWKKKRREKEEEGEEERKICQSRLGKVVRVGKLPLPL
jgi:hypothetical protein